MKTLTIILFLFASIAGKAQVEKTFVNSNFVAANAFADNVANETKMTYKLMKVDSNNTRASFYYSTPSDENLKVEFGKSKAGYIINWITGRYDDLLQYWTNNIQPDEVLAELQAKGKTFKKIPIDANKYWLASFYKAGKDWVIKIYPY